MSVSLWVHSTSTCNPPPCSACNRVYSGQCEQHVGRDGLDRSQPPTDRHQASPRLRGGRTLGRSETEGERSDWGEDEKRRRQDAGSRAAGEAFTIRARRGLGSLLHHRGRGGRTGGGLSQRWKRRAEKIKRMHEYGECISETIRLCPPALLLFRLTSQLCNWDWPYWLWIVHPNLTRANNCKQQIPKFFLSVDLLSFVYCGHFSLKPKDVCREEGRAHRRPRLHVLSKTIRRRQARIWALSEVVQGPPEQLGNITAAASNVSHVQRRSAKEMSRNKDSSLCTSWTVLNLQKSKCGNIFKGGKASSTGCW